MTARRAAPLVTSPPPLRRNDYSLSEQESSVSGLFGDFFRQECPSERVRAAEPVGFDRALWDRLAEVGAMAMGVPEEHGGDGASAVELVLVAEQAGRYLAPVPLVEVWCAARLLACTRGGTLLKQQLAAVAAGEYRIAAALGGWTPGERQLVPAGAVVQAVAGVLGDDLILLESPNARPHVPNLASTPLAWWSPTDEQVGSRRLDCQDAQPRALAHDATLEWKLLTAAALTGLAAGALELGVEYARLRKAFGSPIGSYQAVSHALVDVAIAAEGARRLTRKAAWFWQHERAGAPSLVVRAFRYAAQAANQAATVGVHVQGGFGVSLEADAQLFFRRAKGWSAIAGRADDDLRYLADLELDGGAEIGQEGTGDGLQPHPG